MRIFLILTASCSTLVSASSEAEFTVDPPNVTGGKLNELKNKLPGELDAADEAVVTAHNEKIVEILNERYQKMIQNFEDRMKIFTDLHAHLVALQAKAEKRGDGPELPNVGNVYTFQAEFKVVDDEKIKDNLILLVNEQLELVKPRKEKYIEAVKAALIHYASQEEMSSQTGGDQTGGEQNGGSTFLQTAKIAGQEEANKLLAETRALEVATQRIQAINKVEETLKSTITELEAYINTLLAEVLPVTKPPARGTTSASNPEKFTDVASVCLAQSKELGSSDYIQKVEADYNIIKGLATPKESHPAFLDGDIRKFKCDSISFAGADSTSSSIVGKVHCYPKPISVETQELNA